MDQMHSAHALRAVEGRHPFLDVRILQHVSELRFRQPRSHAPYRFRQRDIFADLLPPTLRVRAENSDYQYQNVVRARSFDPSLSSLTRLKASGLLTGPDLDTVTREVLDTSSTLDHWKVWLVLASLAVELWMSESDSPKRF